MSAIIVLIFLNNISNKQTSTHPAGVKANQEKYKYVILKNKTNYRLELLVNGKEIGRNYFLKYH